MALEINSSEAPNREREDKISHEKCSVQRDRKDVRGFHIQFKRRELL
jgi:hypothetical protein